MPPAICARSAARLMDGFASEPSAATARLEVERTRNCRRVHAREARSVAIQETFVESRRKVPALLDSYPDGFLTPRLRFCDARMTREIRLVLPVANAAGAARPGLDAGVHRLRVQRIAATMCKLGARCAARLGAPGMNNLRPGHVHALGGNFLRHVDGFAARLRLVASLRLQRNRGELRLGPEPLRRQHRLGEIETEIF